MTYPIRVISSLAVTLLLLAASTAAAAPRLSGEANDALVEFGLPKGLLPDSVKSYSVSETGEFTVELKGPCYVRYPSSLVYFDRKITGTLSYGSISNLSGIQAQKFFVWLSVTAIVAHPESNTIEFQVGFISESLAMEEFEKVPKCRGTVGSCRGAAGIAEVVAVSEV